MLGQRRRRWADVVHMLCECFVFAGLFNHSNSYRTVAYADQGPCIVNIQYSELPKCLESIINRKAVYRKAEKT